MKGKLLLSILFLLSISIHSVNAQIKPSVHFTEDDGLAGNTVKDIIKDKNGILWIGTFNGISKFDGDKFQSINRTNGLPANGVWALAADSANTIYAGCYQSGLAIIENDSVKHVVQHKGKYPNSFRKLYYSSYYKKVIVGTDDGIFLLNDTILLPVAYTRDSTTKSIVTSIIGKQDKIFFSVLKGTTEGLYQLFINKDLPEKSHAERIALRGRFATTIVNDTLYNGEYNTIFKYNLRNISEQPSQAKIDSIYLIWSMAAYKNDKYWLGCLGDGRFKGGILQFDLKKNKAYSFPIEQSNTSVNSILSDNTSGLTWFCRDDGLSGYFESPFEYYEYEGKGSILDIGFAGDSLMVLTENEILYLNENHLQPILSKKQVTEKITPEFIKAFKLVKLKRLNLFDSFKAIEFTEFIQDNRKLYINTAIGSISVPDLKTYLPFAVGTFMLKGKGAYSAVNYIDTKYFPSIRDSINYTNPKGTKGGMKDVFKIIESNDTYFFASSSSGLYSIRNNQVLSINESNSTIDNVLTDLDKDSQGNIWCSSADGNLFEIGLSDSLYVKKSLELASAGLVGNTCKWLKFKGNYLFVGTNKGLNVISKKSLYSTKPTIEHFYNSHNGYDFVSAQSPRTDSKGNLYVHTAHQIIKIDTLFNREAQFKINFSEVTINDEKSSIDDIDGKALPYSKKLISFRFNALKYPQNGNISYRYSINNQGWINGNNVNLLSLRSGQYNLILEAFNSEDMQRQSQTITFTIKSPFWKTNWFIVIFAIIMVLAVYLFMKARITWINTQHEKNTRLVIRNSELRLRSLQLQMNPHFIFNALQPLQGFILAKNVEEGLSYISNLAGIIRSNLENASEEFIHLSVEIEFLKKYVEIEKIRFKDKLLVEFNNTVEDSNLLLPPMLIQPIIENAIKHGILNGQKKGNIKVDFRQSANALIVAIEDNGVGREYTKGQNNKDHTNKGLEIIKQRLNLLNAKYINSLHHIVLTDLYHDGKPAGTRVEIQVMLKHAE